MIVRLCVAGWSLVATVAIVAIAKLAGSRPEDVCLRLACGFNPAAVLPEVPE